MRMTRRHDADMKNAWDELVAMLAAGDDTMDQAKARFNEAEEKAADTAREAGRRLADAARALTGRPTPRRWGLIAAVGAIGALAGASAVVAAAQIRRSRRTRTATEAPMVGRGEMVSPAERELAGERRSR